MKKAVIELVECCPYCGDNRDITTDNNIGHCHMCNSDFLLINKEERCLFILELHKQTTEVRMKDEDLVRVIEVVERTLINTSVDSKELIEVIELAGELSDQGKKASAIILGMSLA